MPKTFPSSRDSKTPLFDSRIQTGFASDESGLTEEKMLERLLEVTGPLEGLRILEPGCGTAGLTLELAKQVGPSGCVVAMDVSPQMIAVARQKLSGYRNVKFYLGAAEVRAQSLGRFDQVICHQVFAHFVDQAKALKRLTSLLNPFGLIVISHFMPSTLQSDEDKNKRMSLSGKILPKADNMRELCRSCGLEVENWLDDQNCYLLSARRV